MPHLTTRLTAVTSQRSGPEPNAAPRWGLAAVTALAALLGVKSLFGDWLTFRLVVEPVARDESRHGIGQIGGLGTWYVVGLAVTLALVGVALRSQDRWRARLAGAALGVGVLTLLDLALVVRRLYDLQTTAAGTVARLRAGMDTLPPLVEFHVSSPGAYTGFAAVALLVVAASQLLSTPSTVLPQAALGTGFAVAALLAPWSWTWFIDDKTPDVPFQVRTVWSWTADQSPALLGSVLLLFLVMVGCLRAPGYLRARWTLTTVALAMLVWFVAELIEDDVNPDARLLRDQVSEVPGVSVTGAGSLLAVGAALLAVAAVRAWWHGRDEVPESTSDSRWLPERMRDRR